MKNDLKTNAVDDNTAITLRNVTITNPSNPETELVRGTSLVFLL